MPNEIVAGQHRTGTLISLDGRLPESNATLERDEHGVRVVLPWADHHQPPATWFLNDWSSSDVQRKPLPSQLLFRDLNGNVLFLESEFAGYTTGAQGGVGYIRPRHTVLGPNTKADFTHPHGLQVEVSGLRDWLGVTSISLSSTDTFSLSIVTPPPIQIGGLATLFASWQVVPTPPLNERVTVHNKLICETRAANSATWNDLQEVPFALRDLLTIVWWEPITASMVAVMRDDDPLTDGGVPYAEQWHRLAPAFDAAEPATGLPPYRPDLIAFDDLGEAGLLRWLELREEFGRALDPVISDRLLTRVSPATHLAQVGPGLEALGYLLMLRDGMSERDAAREFLKQRLTRILVDLPEALPFDSQTWVEATADAYNGLKHANRQLPSNRDMLNRWRESVLVMRAWIAAELGVEPATIKARLSSDPRNTPYV